ncbi:vitamin K epoxide reductase family protein [Candidatus Gracilibacteria bacterium]|nr:vitamin K epoxide reductase family protein [Candidatus Gracilibacteria bacterium]
MLTEIQKNKIIANLKGKNLVFFFLWVIIFSGINFHFNEIGIVGMGVFDYENTITIPYLVFTILNTVLIALSINLLIDKMKEVKNLNPGMGIFSFIGTFFALLTGACPGCIAGIFPLFVGLFGSNMSMYSLPFHGAEIQIVSFVFLVIGIYFLSKDMTCKIKKKPMVHKKKLISIFILALIGTFNAAYLTYYAYLSKSAVPVFGGGGSQGFACDYNDTFSCSSVFNHDFAWILGIPFSGIALVVYPALAIIALLALLGKMTNHFKVLTIMVIGGILFNGYIITNEYLVGVYCLLCLMCTLIIIIIGILSKIALCKNKKEINKLDIKDKK